MSSGTTSLSDRGADNFSRQFSLLYFFLCFVQNQLVETFTHDSRDLGRAISSEHDSAGAGIQDNKGGHLSDPLVRILADV